MFPFRSASLISRTRAFLSIAAAAGLAAVGVIALIAPPRAGDASSAPAHGSHHAGAPMTDAAMKEASDAYWRTHPRVGISSTEAADAVVTVKDFAFDNDQNPGTVVDTVRITVGQTVLWQWVSGFHTLTSGVNSGDPDAGLYFDTPIDLSHTQYSYTFTTAGTYPFFCSTHEFMQGVVVVSDPAGVEPRTGVTLGFIGRPSPNPTPAGVQFAFALRQAGRARAEVFDARGRRITVVLDRDLEPGVHSAAWDGRTAGGAAARAGLYYLRLRLPGYAASRQIALTR